MVQLERIVSGFEAGTRLQGMWIRSRWFRSRMWTNRERWRVTVVVDQITFVCLRDGRRINVAVGVMVGLAIGVDINGE